jgi:hypothetical protein
MTIYIPEGRLVHFDESTRGHIGRGIENDRDYYRSSIVGHVWLMDKDGELKCQDCPLDDDDDRDGNGKIIINEDGIDIDIKDNQDSFEMKINEDGIKVKTGEKSNN